MYGFFQLTLPNLYMFIFMVKMSFATWSSLDEEEYRSEVTLMDREVGSNWLDKARPDTSFRFRNYTHNVPQSSTSFVMSTFDHENLYRSTTINSDCLDSH